jgi:two-component system NtrC family response regulator
MNSKPSLLIVEDDSQISRQLKWALRDEYDLHLAKDASAALNIVQSKRPPVITLDLGLPPRPQEPVEGMKLLGQILQYDPCTKVVVLTGNDERETALQCISKGAWDHYQKPIDIDELAVILSRAYNVFSLEREQLHYQTELETQTSFEGLIGSSQAMGEVFAKIRKVAASDVSVLISGESGTGKELIARAIHNQSNRHEKPFVPINCGAIPENLLEAEFFGHEKGAYTGAHVQRRGKVEYADGGTLFLDEIGEIPLLLQVKLLRFLQERVIERVGGRETIDVDVRILAASHKNLKHSLASGDFRDDLYYRLSVVTIEVPPLRDRGNDVLVLAHAFMRRTCKETKMPFRHLDPESTAALLEYDWPGNVRELENIIKRAIVMGEGPYIKLEDLDLPLSRQTDKKTKTLRDFRQTSERDFVFQSLLSNQWNIARTALQLGVSRPTLYDLINKYELKKHDCSC